MYCFFFYLKNGYGGAEQRLARIFNEIARTGLDIDIIIVGTKEDVDKFIHLTVENCAAKIIICKNTIEVIRCVRKNKYRVICFFDSRILFIPILLAGIVKHSKRLMTVAYTKYSILEFESIKTKLIFHCIVSLSNHIDLLYPSCIKTLKDRYPRKAITATPNSFTDLDRFVPQAKEKIIAFVSRLIEEKNPSLFLKSIELCQKKIRETGYQVMICGDGPEYELSVRYAEEHRISDIVRFTGFIDPQNVLGKADIFISLQKLQNYPSQSLLEAISSGCFIIATDVGDTSLIVKDDFGRLVDMQPESISRAIRDYLCMEQSSKESIVLSARDFAVKNFQIDQSSEYFRKLLLELGGNQLEETNDE